jgi:hypothetical protein
MMMVEADMLTLEAAMERLSNHQDKPCHPDLPLEDKHRALLLEEYSSESPRWKTKRWRISISLEICECINIYRNIENS